MFPADMKCGRFGGIVIRQSVLEESSNAEKGGCNRESCLSGLKMLPVSVENCLSVGYCCA